MCEWDAMSRTNSVRSHSWKVVSQIRAYLKCDDEKDAKISD